MEPRQVEARQGLDDLFEREVNEAIRRHRGNLLRRFVQPSDPNPFPKFHLFRWRKP